MGEPEGEKEVESILTDLESILSGTPPATPPAKEAPAKAIAAKPADVPEIKLSASTTAPAEATPPIPASAPPPPTISLPAAAPPPVQAKPAVQAPPLVQAPPPVQEPPPVSVPTPATAATPPAAAPQASGVPENTPKDQIRRVGFLYAPEQKGNVEEFLKFIDSVALKVSKKPLYIERVMVSEFPEQGDPKLAFEQAKAGKAVGVVGVLASLPESRIREIEEVFSENGMFYRTVHPDDMLKRSTVVDLLVDLMLSSPA